MCRTLGLRPVELILVSRKNPLTLRVSRDPGEWGDITAMTAWLTSDLPRSIHGEVSFTVERLDGGDPILDRVWMSRWMPGRARNSSRLLGRTSPKPSTPRR